MKNSITDEQRMDWIEANASGIECTENIAGNLERFTIEATREDIDREMDFAHAMKSKCEAMERQRVQYRAMKSE